MGLAAPCPVYEVRQPQVVARVLVGGCAHPQQLGALVGEDEDYACIHELQCVVGERNIDGYGNIKIQKLDDLKDRYGKAEPLDCRAGINDNYNVSLLQPVMTEIIISDWLDEKINENMSSSSKSGLDNTQIGRVTLMLKESVNEGKNDKEVKDKFVKRIDSIKSESTKSKAKKLYDNAKKVCKADLDSKHAKELTALGYKQDEVQTMMEKQWSEYLMQILVYEKYTNK